jgi:hypothetical protein
MPTKLFDWNTPLKTGQKIMLLNRYGNKSYKFTVDGVTDPKLCIRGEHDLACGKWYPDAVLPSFALEEIPKSFIYLGKERGIHQFQQTKMASDKKPNFFPTEAKNRKIATSKKS